MTELLVQACVHAFFCVTNVDAMHFCLQCACIDPDNMGQNDILQNLGSSGSANDKPDR